MATEQIQRRGWETIEVLGLPFAVADYQSAFERLLELAKAAQPVSVALCATHPVAEAQRHQAFRLLLAGFDMILPDGMPVVWLMNTRGARLKDRVYGPYFMRYVVERTPRPYRHFLFGGSEDCLRALRTALLKLQPDLEIAGSLSPPFREWNEVDEEQFARAIQQAGPDFVWVALGGGKQEYWIAQNKHRHARGVFLGVGDAFELLAGRRSFAPMWMQRTGLTWIYRLWQEPRRLWKRYLFHNLSFAKFALRQVLGDCLGRNRRKHAPKD
jgi:N-acetylglucosaminyldiphosphoundecaprenol N-acetyl-beta-D-mannosaminyltransferase